MTKGRYRVGFYEYRDDRKFVMNLEPAGQGRWNLVTYRNTGGFPPVRDDAFDNFELATAYVKKIEPKTPLLSLDGRSLSLGELDKEEKYTAYVGWLNEHALFSTLELKRHVPFWIDERGWTDKKAVVSVRKKKIIVDGVALEETTRSYPLREV